jgi:CubicO group peptidase (beta-lactamase class C family)
VVIRKIAQAVDPDGRARMLNGAGANAPRDAATGRSGMAGSAASGTGRIGRRPVLLALLALAAAAGSARAQTAASSPLAGVVAQAAELRPLHTLVIARDGQPLVEEVFRGPGLDAPVNVKSVAKSVLSALVGIAIERGVLTGVDQPVVPLLGKLVPPDVDPRTQTITVDHLLSMRAGLERTSGRNYGRWVNSADWVGFALSRPFVDAPGGRMLYSTGSSHLLSAALTQASGRSTLDLARDWLGAPLGIEIPAWTRDPQGIYLGGNNMLLSARALLRFGELYRLDGRVAGRQVLPASWIEASWTPRTSSPFTGHLYGYGWFIAKAGAHLVYYAWGYGGQMIYVVPSLALTVVMTSDDSGPSGRNGYVRQLHALLAGDIIQAIEGARTVDAAPVAPGSGG